jgi:thiol:disulfide interchange protein DsbD
MNFSIKFLLLPLLALFTLLVNVNAQIEFPEDKVSWEFSIEQDGCNATIVGKITCIEHWHVYAANLPEGSFLLPTEIEPDQSTNYEVVGKVIEPKPEFYHDEAADEDIYQHSHTFILKRKIKISSEKDFTLKGRFSFQTCDETHCLPPFDTDFTLKVKGCGKESSEDINESNQPDSTTDVIVITNDTMPQVDSNEIETSEAVIKPSNVTKEDEGKEDKSIWGIFWLAFASGLAALLTPCVFPMIPMTVSFFTKQSKSKSQGIRNAIFYGISIVVIYVLLGSVVTLFVSPDVINEISTGVGMNIFFFILLVVFAISFMGAFEITLPSSWVNKADKASDRGGLIGIFFMALVLALVSFSCTGPIVGALLVESATVGGYVPIIGMLGFSIALALPFGLFAAFPGWMNSLPQSGGWLTTVKVFLGFLELALAFKFLSNADLVMQGHYLEREVFLSIWIGVFGVLALYLLGFIRLPHDGPTENLSVGRTLLGTFTVIFVIYLIPGLWGAPLKLISGFPPPMSYSESPHGVGSSGNGKSASAEHGPEGTHLGAQGIYLFHDLDEGLAYAKKVGKPAFLDFTGWACVNCRKMEENVWGQDGVLEIMRDKVVIISLYVDEKAELPIEEQKEVEFAPGKTRMLKTVGNKWSYYQTKNYKINTQPYYRMLGPNEEDLGNGSADYEHHGNRDDFKAWLEEGLKLYEEAK